MDVARNRDSSFSRISTIFRLNETLQWYTAQNPPTMTTDSIMITIDEIVQGIYMMPPRHFTRSQIVMHEATQAARMANLRKSLIEEAFCTAHAH